MVGQLAHVIELDELDPRFRNIPAAGAIEEFIYSKNTSMGLDDVRLYNKTFGRQTSHYVERVRFGNGALVRYEQCVDQDRHHVVREESMANLTRGDYNGYLSPATARKCKRILEVWINSINTAAASKLKDRISSQIYTTFLTLTLPHKQVHDDNQIKREVLMPFIQDLQRNLGCGHYFWKAEPQQNENIHFHMLLDCYIDTTAVDQFWGRHCETLGYVSRYCEESGSLFPPACNIVSLSGNAAAIPYVIKYLAKAPVRLRSITPANGFTSDYENWEEECADLDLTTAAERKDYKKHVRNVFRAVNKSYWQEKKGKNGQISFDRYRPIDGRVWGCSDALREIKPPTMAVSDRVEMLQEYCSVNRKAKVKQIDRALVIICAVPNAIREFDAGLWKLWRWHHLATFRWLYMGRDEPPSGNYYELGRGLQECST